MNSVTLAAKLANPPAPDEPMDWEVIRLAWALNEAGFHTDYSCGGHGGWPFVAFPVADQHREERLAAYLAARCDDPVVWVQRVWRPGGGQFWMIKLVHHEGNALAKCDRAAEWVREWTASERLRDGDAPASATPTGQEAEPKPPA